MSEKTQAPVASKPAQTTAEYINSVHRLGRIAVVVSIIIMLAIPISITLAFNSWPGWGLIFSASIGLGAIFIPLGISEVISYTPVLGSSMYLTLITGNIMNLKLPVATTAMNLLNVENGSEDADVIGGIAIGVSSIVTMLIIALGVLLSVPLQPVLQHPAVVTASGYILPALFGSMALGIFSDNIGGGVRVKKRLLGALPGAIIVTILFFVLGSTFVSTFQGILIVVMLPVTYFTTKFFFKKGIVKVILPSDGAAREAVTDPAEAERAEEQKPL